MAHKKINNFCSLCNQTINTIYIDRPYDYEYFYERKIIGKFYKCLNCKSLLQLPTPSLHEASLFYSTEYQNYLNPKFKILSKIYSAYLNSSVKYFINKYTPSISVLDFGCGPGYFAKALKDNGCEKVVAFDFYINKPLHLGNEIDYYSDLLILMQQNIKFDVIRLNHVIEHLPDPCGTLTILVGLLNKNGRITGQTPNSNHYTLKLFKEFWGALHYPYHIFIFNQDSLELLALKIGMKNCFITPSAMTTGWAMSIENIYKKITGSKKSGRSFLYLFFLVISLPFSAFDLFFGKNQTSIINFEIS